MDRFKGKVNKVSRLGVNALLFQGEENLPSYDISSFKDSPMNTPKRSESRKSVILKPLPESSAKRSRSVDKLMNKSKGLNPELKRHPSQKLPSLGRSLNK